MKKSNIKIDLLNENEVNDINANLEYNIVIVGSKGKYIIKKCLLKYIKELEKKRYYFIFMIESNIKALIYLWRNQMPQVLEQVYYPE